MKTFSQEKNSITLDENEKFCLQDRIFDKKTRRPLQRNSNEDKDIIKGIKSIHKPIKNPSMPIDQEKLAKLQKLSANNKVGGTRRKMGKKTGSLASSNKDDTKLQAQLAKLHAVTVDNVAEANFFKDDGNVLHFNKVGVQVAPQHNTSVFYGLPQEKGLQELFPNIISQMGPEAIQALTQLSSQLQQAQQGQNPGSSDAAVADAAGSSEKKDESIPELVEGQTFDADVE